MPYSLWTILCLTLALTFAFLEFFIPSGGLLAFLSASALLGSIVFAFLTNQWFGCGYLVGVLIVVPLLIWYAVQLFPRSLMGRRLMLNPDEDPALQPDPQREALKLLVGKTGTAQSKMMLSGLVEIDGRRFNAVSELETVELGEEVIVTKFDGTSILVQKTQRVPKTTAAKTEQNGEPEPVEDPFA